MKASAILLSLLVLGSSSAAFAQVNLIGRCSQDQLGSGQAVGRNAWSRRWGYISTNAENFYNSEGTYVVYTTGCGYPGCNPLVPTSESANYVSGLVKLGTCLAGCYTPKQKLRFDGKYSGIHDAYQAGLPSVTALTKDSTSDSMSFSEQPIHAYVAGETSEKIFVLRGENGEKLEVTSEHPLVTDLGEIVKAHQLRNGDALLNEQGKPVRLLGIDTYSYSGLVWNIQPESHEKIENIIVAEGFLTGSVRFQNEWADDGFRLSLRDELDVSTL